MFLTIDRIPEIKKHAEEVSPEECCGLIVNKNNQFIAIPTKNVSEFDRTHSMRIDPADYYKASLEGEIVAFYHSHKDNCVFSEYDKLNSENHQLPCVLYCVDTEEVGLYIPNGYEVPYVGREYVSQRFDCFTLVQDYFQRELNVTIYPIVHPYRFVEDKAGHPDNSGPISWVLRDHFLNNGFVEVKKASEKHDLILCSTPRVSSPVHCLIYIPENQILHHPYKRKSTIELYSQYWNRYTINILRHGSRA